jgi:hypothetical protein
MNLTRNEKNLIYFLRYRKNHILWAVAGFITDGQLISIGKQPIVFSNKELSNAKLAWYLNNVTDFKDRLMKIWEERELSVDEKEYE